MKPILRAFANIIKRIRLKLGLYTHLRIGEWDYYKL